MSYKGHSLKLEHFSSSSSVVIRFIAILSHYFQAPYIFLNVANENVISH